MNYNATVHQGALQMFWHHSYKVIRGGNAAEVSGLQYRRACFQRYPKFLATEILRCGMLGFNCF